MSHYRDIDSHMITQHIYLLKCFLRKLRLNSVLEAPINSKAIKKACIKVSSHTRPQFQNIFVNITIHTAPTIINYSL